MTKLHQLYAFKKKAETIVVKHDPHLNHDYAVAGFDMEPGTIICGSQQEIFAQPNMHYYEWSFVCS